jgi:hypothetical protein
VFQSFPGTKCHAWRSTGLPLGTVLTEQSYAQLFGFTKELVSVVQLVQEMGGGLRNQSQSDIPRLFMPKQSVKLL